MAESYKMFPLSIDEAVPMLERLFKDFENADSPDEDRFVPILISKPGVGKSSTIDKMARRMGYSIVDLNLACIEPTDIIGLGAREKVGGVWQTMTALPQWAETAFAGNCIILVDEFNNTTQDVIAGFQKMFSDFVIDGRKLPRTTHIIGACNPPGVDALFAAKRLSGAFRRRLCMLPIVDDFEYVMKKHSFKVSPSYLSVDYKDISDYCSYADVSSAVVDNLFNISHNYSNLSDYEKAALINGFGQGALAFSGEHGLISKDILASGKKFYDEEIEEGEWLKDPDDVVPYYNQILWGQSRINRSTSYSRSKTFVSKVKNPKVYSALYEILRDRFEVEYLSDESKLPESREED